MLFGATGDLARRKLLPGLAYLVQSALAPDIEIVGTSLEDIASEEFRALAKEAVDEFGTHKLSEERVGAFAETAHLRAAERGPGGAGRGGRRGRGRARRRNVRRLHYL